MPSNNGIEQAVSDVGGIVSFNVSAYLNSIGFKFFTQLALVALEDLTAVYNLLAAGVGFR